MTLKNPMFPPPLASPSKRSFLRLVSLAAVAAGAPAAYSGSARSMQSATIAATPENPRLLKLGRMLDAAEQWAATATKALEDARSRFEAIRPRPPKDLIVRRDDALYVYAERETDVEGHDLWPSDPVTPPRMILREDALRFLKTVSRSRFGKRIARLQSLAERYEAATEVAREAVGASAAVEAVDWSSDTIRRLARATSKTPALTARGLAIKGRALIAHAQYDENAKHCAGGWWGLALAKNAVNIARAA